MKFARLACVLSLISFCASVSDISAKAPETATVFKGKHLTSNEGRVSPTSNTFAFVSAPETRKDIFKRK